MKKLPAKPIVKRASRDRSSLLEFVDLCGAAAWSGRVAEIGGRVAKGARAGRALQTHHAVELTVARLLRDSGAATPAASPTAMEQALAELARACVRIADGLTPTGRARLRARLVASLTGRHSLVPLFHLLRTAELQASRGFAVGHAWLEEGAPFDLLLSRDGAHAELSCETVSAEDGRGLHRSAWFNLVDGIDPDLQNWLSHHPGRYLLKMTLPQGLREASGASDDGGLAPLAELQRRICDMLSRQSRTDQDGAAVLRLDPLSLAGAQASELGLMDNLRHQFGPEAQLAVTRSGNGMLVMAARAGRENDIGAAVRRRMQQATPQRFSGTRPGILAMFVDDADRGEWRALRDGLQLEGETRQFLTRPEAAGLVAVTAASRTELFGVTGADAAADGELRFRNQAHPAAKSGALSPAIRSSF